MTPGASETELLALLRMELGARLEPAGWTAVEIDSFNEIAAFVRSLEGDFAVTAELGGTISLVPGEEVCWPSHLRAGVSYEPLRRLWPLLGEEFRVSLLDEQICENTLLPRITTVAEVKPAAEFIAAQVLEHAVAFAEPFASLDALLAELNDEDEPDFSDYRFPAVLAAAGRFDGARAAVADFRPALAGRTAREPPGGSRFRRYLIDVRKAKRLARQLSRWIESGGDPRLLPREPPVSHPQESESMSEMMDTARSFGKAVEAVRGAGGANDRDELRLMLEEELTSRGLRSSPVASPLWFEQTLDELEDPDAAKARRSAEARKVLGSFGLGVLKAIRERKLPDNSKPGWLDPPDRAACPVPRGALERWTAVVIDSDSDEWLDRVFTAAVALRGHTAYIDAWLNWGGRDPASRSLAVHIGERQVGTLDEPATGAFSPIMGYAAERDELPCTAARLTELAGGRCLLEVQLPPA